jgi:hypothetical protein
MALIQISNLTAAGNDLLAGTESFLTELQDTDTTQIIGGGGHGRGCGSKKGSKKSKKGSRSGGCGYCH